jgi:16S rRNA (guanine527-N7)-methyltransferase
MGRHCERSEANQGRGDPLDCFASLAMTVRSGGATPSARHERNSAQMNRDREAALDLCPRLGSAIAELEIYERLLRRWQDKINLVATPTLDEIWVRHFADSAQILDVFPDVSRWADLGSGAGFPGMVLALCLKDRPGAKVHLIESDQRKAAFLRAVSRETNAPTTIHVGRIEKELPLLLGQIDGVTSRAVAPLSQLLAWSHEHLLKDAVCAFLKGEDWHNELTASQAMGSFQMRAIPSRTHPSARLITVSLDPTRLR